MIALDIDGTLTNDPFKLSERVLRALESYYKEGWSLIFLTGRPFGWGSLPLRPLTIPYYVAAINGADVIAMPERQLVASKALTLPPREQMDAICAGEESDYVLYGGFIAEDRCYYRPSHFAPSLLNYLEERYKRLGEEWIAVDDFTTLPLTRFSSVKSFGAAAMCYRIAEKMKKQLGWRVSVIRDPFQHDHYVAQATVCDKGEALRAFIAKMAYNGPIIAAGDDYNDVSMLEVADVKIVMSTAPEAVRAMADIIAAPAAEDGIIAALETAVMSFKHTS